MFKKKGEEGLAAQAPKEEEEEHAYEDAWYRALKAQSEGTLENDETTETTEPVEAVEAVED